MFRYVTDKTKCFDKRYPCSIVDIDFERTPIYTADELIKHLKNTVADACNDGKAAIALSGGIDSAILAYFAPKGTKAYTFRCIVPGKTVIDESAQAAHWAKLCDLDHEVVDITWQDVEDVVDRLMLHKGAPIHSIEAQIYIAAQKAVEAGYTKFIFGENADIIYGGMDGLLAKDWSYAEFADRYTYVMPYKVLKDPLMVVAPYLAFEKAGHIDGHDFINTYFRQEALGTYHNACETAGIEFVGPYSETYLDGPIDYKRIRNGESKYLIREVFGKLYPDETPPVKIPMPRPTTEWFADWEGPVREEFIPYCTADMSGDQKWMIWALERFLNILDGEV
ncbi:MAG: asparagine synthase C-terminal domain-containing protein [Lachnospiraceae bacterium]|nr:asparagine synthase C-terminal domain-containing protein [Lachnospiraceae bacterium]